MRVDRKNTIPNFQTQHSKLKTNAKLYAQTPLDVEVSFGITKVVLN